MADDPRRTDGASRPRLGWARFGAYAAILLERVFPTLLGVAAVAAAFLILSWFGIFAAAPGLLRMAILAVLAVVLLLVVWRARRLRLPSRSLVDRRIETESRLDHQPLRTQSDRATSQDPFAVALWREHQRRMSGRLKDLTGGTPRTRTEMLDPLALRALVAMLFVTAFAYSYGAGGGRIMDAFEAPIDVATVGGRVDAWITPPSYTGRPPIFLTEAERIGTADGGGGGPVEVPEGSILSVRVSDGAGSLLRFTPTGGEAREILPGGLPVVDAATAGSAAANVVATGTPAPASAGTAAGARSGEFEYRLQESGSAALTTGLSRRVEWSFAVTPDRAPTIAFAADPAAARNGALELAYDVSDDYGVRRGTVAFELKEAVAPGARPLVAAPEIALAPPRRAKGEARGRTLTDITESPYAGADVAMTLVVTDDPGQTGRSEPKTMTLPERRFTNPLARAVIEQRRMLALDANAARRVVDMLDAVTLRGEEFIEDPSDYLALRAVRTRIATASGDEALISAVDFMWEIALGIEDGNLSLAERKLRDAREQLSEALDKGASDEEIDQLMQELREAMQEYMQAMAEAMKNMPPMSQQEMANMQELRPQDIDRMLDKIEDLAKAGSKDAAQQLLSELQSMMDNLQAMKPGQQQQSGEQSAMQQQMDKLGEMLRRQQELKDKTFDLGRQQVERQQQREQSGDGQQQPGEGHEPMTAEQLQQALEQLQQQQGQLQKELQEMQDAMAGMGMKPGEGLGEAGEAMGRAEGALGQGNDGDAVGEQGQAMEALRRGAQDMMQQMQQAMGQGQGPGQQQGQQGQMGEGFGQGREQSGRDPLGRQRSTQGADFGQDVEVPDEIDTQRARRILDSIRSRLGNQLSPQQERDYLERLLQTP